MLITKVKFSASKGEVTVVATEDDGDGERTISVRSKDAPRPEFHAALEALKDPALALVYASREQRAGATPLGVRVKHGRDGFGACASLLVRVDRCGPFSITTPFTEDERMPPELLAAVEEVMAEGARYLRGDRAQRALFPLPGEEVEAHEEAAL